MGKRLIEEKTELITAYAEERGEKKLREKHQNTLHTYKYIRERGKSQTESNINSVYLNGEKKEGVR